MIITASSLQRYKVIKGTAESMSGKFSVLIQDVVLKV